MATEILQKVGTPIVWAADGSAYDSSDSGYTQTNTITLNSLADAAARQGDYADLGATRAAQYAVRAAIETAAAPTAGEAVYYYWSAATDATAGYDGGCTGEDGAYKAGDEAEWVKQLQLIGVLTCTADTTGVVQTQTVGYFSPPTRYGAPVVWNECGQAFNAGDSTGMFLALVPIVDESQ